MPTTRSDSLGSPASAWQTCPNAARVSSTMQVGTPTGRVVRRAPRRLRYEPLRRRSRDRRARGHNRREQITGLQYRESPQHELTVTGEPPKNLQPGSNSRNEIPGWANPRGPIAQIACFLGLLALNMPVLCCRSQQVCRPSMVPHPYGYHAATATTVTIAGQLVTRSGFCSFDDGESIRINPEKAVWRVHFLAQPPLIATNDSRDNNAVSLDTARRY